MPKGKKICPACDKEHGARKLKCECGHVFGSKKPKQGRQSVKQTKHPLGQKYVPEPGLWVFDRPKEMSPVHAPCDLPSGPIDNQELYDQCVYSGLGDCVMERIPSRKIADPKLRKLWKKAHDAMLVAWSYLIDEHEQNPRQ
jgi:hypothetical protein